MLAIFVGIMLEIQLWLRVNYARHKRAAQHFEHRREHVNTEQYLHQHQLQVCHHLSSHDIVSIVEVKYR